MSSKDAAGGGSVAPVTKKFGKGTRTVPHASQRAQKYYPAEDVRQAKKVWSYIAVQDVVATNGTVG